MTYSLEFLEDAKKEWDLLDHSIRLQFSKKLKERKDNPEVPKDKLSGLKDCFKIKLRSVGYRLVYRVCQDRIVIEVVAIGRREKNEVYRVAYLRS